MEYPAATMAIRRLERQLKFDNDLAKKVQRVLKLLQVELDPRDLTSNRDSNGNTGLEQVADC